ncbi:hypothetical protein ACJRO7_028352 [Eucalyptus globulus]|uniref:UspA domain-containing protein n=1 Tax=Eucalyptus globulus TaxID=34317 RepID=A0ABD3K743_EUCGL
MVGMDDSECSHHALRWALQNLGQTFSGTKLLLFPAQPLLEFSCVFVSSFARLNIPKQLKFASSFSSTVDLISDLQEDQRKGTLLANAKEICAKHGAVEKLDVQLPILGSHGQGAIQRAFLGSVNDYCVHNAKCPVLVVKKPA